MYAPILDLKHLNIAYHAKLQTNVAMA